jgi:hypothetical protein
VSSVQNEIDVLGVYDQSKEKTNSIYQMLVCLTLKIKNVQCLCVLLRSLRDY